MELKNLLESLFFVSYRPLTIKELVDFSKKDLLEVEEAIKELSEEYSNNNRGLRIIENNKKYQMASSPENAKLIQAFLQSEVSGELTPASLETLTIIAYRGPIKKIELEKIRGINCSLILRNLLIKGLIEEKAGREDDDNEYVVSLEFVKFLGIDNLKDLPEYEKFNKNEEIDKLLGKTDPLWQSAILGEDEEEKEKKEEEADEDSLDN
ncbi:MAG: SMC-Scp complex subunit ScpB [Patescibacteria group bacterium]|jgi:segregation and condensation protein B